MDTEAMRRPLVLAFDEQSFTIRPFTVDQVISLETLLGTAAVPGEEKATALHQARDALAIALGEDHPEVDVSKIRLRAIDLAKSLTAIIGHAGFTDDPASGEAAAAA